MATARVILLKDFIVKAHPEVLQADLIPVVRGLQWGARVHGMNHMPGTPLSATWGCRYCGQLLTHITR
jgi:hypothetical protein